MRSVRVGPQQQQDKQTLRTCHISNHNNNIITNNNNVQAVRRTVASAKLKKNQAHAQLYQKCQAALGAAKVRRRLHRAVPRV